MFLPIVYFCTTTRSGRFGQVIVDTVKFLLPIATRNLPTSVNINLNASVKKISAIGCARHQIDQSIKFPQSFCSVNNNIVCALSGYALFASLDCIVRDRRSRNATNNSVTGISSAIATRSKVSTLGLDLPLNHSDQFFISTPVTSLNCLKVKFKNSLSLVGLVANIAGKIVECVGYFTNVPHITKHPRDQVLCPNQTPEKAGSFKKLYDEYTRPRGRSPSPPSFTMRSHPDMESAVMQDYLADIPTGREGYIYLIHAEGTKRYKIGRSVNPIARASDIQKQSPYKLKIVRSSWTLDAPGDEASLHREFADYRVHGEWFELEKDNIHSYCCWGIDMAFDYPPTIYKVARASIVKLGQSLELEISNHPVMSSTGADILDLYQVLSSRQEIQLTQEFFNGGLQSIIKDRYHLIFKEDLEKEAFLQDLVNFIAGVIATFKIMVLKKGAWHELA